MARRNRPINMPAPYLKRVWLDPSRIERPRGLSILPARYSTMISNSVSTARSPSSSARTAPANRPCWKGSPRSPAMTKPAAARVICRSIIRTRLRRWAVSCPTALRASWLPKITNGWFFRAESFFSVARYLDKAARETGGRAAGFSLPFPWRGLFALLRGALPAAGHLHLRRAGIRAVAVAPDGVLETDAADGRHRATARSSWPRIRQC